MEKYKIIREVGRGSYGSVFQALNKETGQVVAIKMLKKKYYSWRECLNLREVKSLRELRDHAHIVKLQEIIKESNVLYFVFEFMDCNLHQLIKARATAFSNTFSEDQIKTWCFQIFQGLAYMHGRGIFHRDLKPENLLLSTDLKIKIADFGLAREINSSQRAGPLTEYVVTRWYRAPEILLRLPNYGPEVDMWAMGAIMAELFNLRPLFPGNSQADQLYKICCAIGRPKESDWADGLELARALNYQFPRISCDVHVNLHFLIPSASELAIDLIRSLCSWDPKKRPTALEALCHPFFRGCCKAPPELGRPNAVRAAARTRDSLTLQPGWANLKPTNNFNAPRYPYPYPPPPNPIGMACGVFDHTFDKLASLTIA